MGDGNGYGDGDDDVDGRGVKDTTRGSKQDAWTPWHLINSMCRQGTRLYLDQGGAAGCMRHAVSVLHQVGPLIQLQLGPPCSFAASDKTNCTAARCKQQATANSRCS